MLKIALIFLLDFSKKESKSEQNNSGDTYPSV
jgi:hypothetical protein